METFLKVVSDIEAAQAAGKKVSPELIAAGAVALARMRRAERKRNREAPERPEPPSPLPYEAAQRELHELRYSVGLTRKEAEELEGGTGASNVGRVEDKIGEVRTQEEELEKVKELKEKLRVLRTTMEAKRRRLHAVEGSMSGWVKTGCKLVAVEKQHKGVWEKKGQSQN
ncbi:unnamed protein product [Ostreobium quekettii]|uniref:Uncharacterized protein n=1 Tax=Ostreobium quekettii TaxID=121088 RepID=A0A8S1IWB5_9CHLO|nr:unnamed protein product [Ostreobium quekettii]